MRKFLFIFVFSVMVSACGTNQHQTSGSAENNIEEDALIYPNY